MIPSGEVSEAEADRMEALVPVAAELIEAVRETGPDVVGGILDHLDKATLYRLTVLLAAMVSPDAGMRALLGWTDAMIPGPAKDRAEMTKDGGWDPPAERERQRLVAAGVPADAAIVMASRSVIERQDTIRDRMLRVVARDGLRTA